MFSNIIMKGLIIVKKTYVGEGKVVLIAGGGKIYTDIAARFVKSERALEDIIASPYNKKIVKTIIDSGHKAAVEFDYFIFGVEGYSRVTEVQLVRKRLASYIIKSGRVNQNGKRSFSMVLPKSIEDFKYDLSIPVEELKLDDGSSLKDHIPTENNLVYSIDSDKLMTITKGWYDDGVEKGVPEEDLRYLKPQATEFKGIIGMNAHALLDWFGIRCCKNAQKEIRDMANKMMKICKEVAPDIFKNAGPNCKAYGYCPENSYQNVDCRGKIITKEKALEIIKQYNKENL